MARHSFNEPWIVRRVGKGGPQFPDGGVQTIVKFHIGIFGPELLSQFVTAYKLARPLQKDRQNFKRLVLQPDSNTAFGEPRVGEICLEQPKSHHVFYNHVRHIPTPYCIEQNCTTLFCSYLPISTYGSVV